MQILIIAVLSGMGFVLLILVFYAGGNWLLFRLKKPKLPSKESLRRYGERLLNPRWEELEEYLGQSIPERMKQLYANTQIINRRDIRLSNAKGATYDIDQFLPADIEMLDGVWSGVRQSGNFLLATDAFGDCYYIPLTEDKSERCPVMRYHHDGSDLESVSTSLDEFLNDIEGVGVLDDFDILEETCAYRATRCGFL